MKLKDLKFVNYKPKVEPERTHLRMFIVRFTSSSQSLIESEVFLQTAEQTAAPTEFESPPENSRHIELDIYVPTDGLDSPGMLSTAEQYCSSSQSSSSSSSESDAESKNGDDDHANADKLRVPCPRKRPKIEEVEGEIDKPLP
uniref:Uncharacterized protein n=1 Tax=Schistocephalus solidus TaxID=70667 RepID=A0A0V0JB47_SCHSO